MLYSAYLRPSRELLEYYRKKIAEFDDEHESMLQRLDQYKMTYEEQVSFVDEFILARRRERDCVQIETVRSTSLLLSL